VPGYQRGWLRLDVIAGLTVCAILVPEGMAYAQLVVLLDLSLTPEVDVPVVEALEDLHQRLAAEGIELWLSHLQPGARDLLDRAGTLAVIGAAGIHARAVDGILAFVFRLPGADERVAVLADLLRFIRERAAQPGTSTAGVETLDALERRLAAELAAAGGTSGQLSAG
jgi:MFS superfamily sulfate permease-like transporter